MTGAAFPRRFGAGVLAVILTALVPGPDLAAQDGDPPETTERAETLRAFLEAKDPALRGEAALALAALGLKDDIPRIEALASDRSPEAAARAILAVGEVARPGCQHLLRRIANDDSRPDLVRQAAHFALGKLPGTDAQDGIDDLMLQLEMAGFDRGRELIAALAAGVVESGEDQREGWLRRFLEDETIRDPELRLMLAQALAALGSTLRDEILDRLLNGDEPNDRHSASLLLANDPAEPDRRLAKKVQGLARSERDAGARIAHLEVLIAWDHRDVESVATRMSRVGDPRIAAAGYRVLLERLSPKKQAKLLEKLEDADRAILEALFVQSETSPNEGLKQLAPRLLNDPNADPRARRIAASLCAEEMAEVARLNLRELLTDCRDADEFAATLRLLQSIDGLEASTLDELRDLDSTDSEVWSARLQGLARVQPDWALPMLEAAIETDEAHAAAALQSWRLATSSKPLAFPKKLAGDLQQLIGAR